MKQANKLSADSVLKANRTPGFVQAFVFSLVVLLLLAKFHQSPIVYLLVSVFSLKVMLVALSVRGTSMTVRLLLIALWVLALMTRWVAPSGLDALFALGNHREKSAAWQAINGLFILTR